MTALTHSARRFDHKTSCSLASLTVRIPRALRLFKVSRAEQPDSPCGLRLAQHPRTCSRIKSSTDHQAPRFCSRTGVRKSPVPWPKTPPACTFPRSHHHVFPHSFLPPGRSATGATAALGRAPGSCSRSRSCSDISLHHSVHLLLLRFRSVHRATCYATTITAEYRSRSAHLSC